MEEITTKEMIQMLEPREEEEEEKITWEGIKKEIAEIRASIPKITPKQAEEERNRKKSRELWKKQALTHHQIVVKIVERICKKSSVKVLDKGWPDLLLVKENKVLFVEIKTGRIGKLTSEQVKVKEVLEKLGLEYRVVNLSRGGVEETIEELIKEW